MLMTALTLSLALAAPQAISSNCGWEFGRWVCRDARPSAPVNPMDGVRQGQQFVDELFRQRQAAQTRAYNPPAPVTDQMPLRLQCDGMSDRNGDQRAARATIEVDGEEVRVRAPHELFNTVTGSRQDIWRDLSHVEITSGEIKGRVSPNRVSRMSVAVDRMSGEARIQVSDPLGGGASFVGDCVPIQDTPRF